MKNKNVLILGGGIVGCSIALELAKLGVRKVTLVDQGKIGEACSFGNAGWLTPCFALPLAMPGAFLQSLKWLMNPESPLYIKPSLSPDLLSWLARFLVASTEKKAIRATESLVGLSLKSLALYKELAQEFPNEFAFSQKGLLMISETQAGLAAIRKELAFVEKFSVRGRELSVAEVLDSQAGIRGKVTGGVFFPSEAAVEPYQLVKTIARKAKSLGVEFMEDCEIINVPTKNGRIEKCIGKSMGLEKELQADVYVFAMGSWSKSFARNMGLEVPVLGGKGYSMNVGWKNNRPNQPIMLVDRKIAITPYQDYVRVAGTLELVDQDFSVTEKRVEVIRRGVREVFQESAQINFEVPVWRGLRPCTPDGLPLIGWSRKLENLLMACGHQMLGLQTGLGTGNLVAKMICNQSSELNSSSFAPSRFAT